jgi:hypothetical protein
VGGGGFGGGSSPNPQTPTPNPHEELRVGPEGIVAQRPVAGVVHHEPQLREARDREVDAPSRLSGPDNAALVKEELVAVHGEANAAGARFRVIGYAESRPESEHVPR